MDTRAGRAPGYRTKNQAQPAGRTFFLGIGVNTYEHWNTLSNAVGDVEAIVDLLQQEYGLESAHTTLIFNEEASEDNIIHQLERMAYQVEKEDSLLIYYAGHGHLDEHKNGFWIPVDGPRDRKNRWIRNSTLINDYVAKIKSLHTLLISDSCYSGSLFSSMARAGQEHAQELMRLRSRWAICSGRGDQTVSDGKPGERSPFAKAILDALSKTQQEYITAGWLLEQVSEQTRTNFDQLPDGGPLNGVGHERGQYVFRRRVDEATIWGNTQLADTHEAYSDYLAAFPNGTYAIEAALAIREIKHAAELNAEIQEAVEEIEVDKITKAKRLLEGIRKDVEKQITREVYKAPLLQQVQHHLTFCQYYTAYRPIFEKILGSDQRAALAAAQAETKGHASTIARLEQQLAEKTTQLTQAATDLATAQTAQSIAAATEKQLRGTIAKLETQLSDTLKELRELKTRLKSPKPIPPKYTDNMIFIPGGTFQMGDVMEDKEQHNEQPHRVTVAGFYLSPTEVTFAEYDAFCTATGREKPGDSGWGRANRPVINVSWCDAVEYANWLSTQNGLQKVYSGDCDNIKANWTANGYRLPTEAEWEYAAREGGKKVRFGNGKDVIDPKDINFLASESYKKPYSIVGEYREKTVPVGSLNSPNSFGLHDMSGNVLEWCWDWYGDDYYISSPEQNPRGAAAGSGRVLRGGYWNDFPRGCRAADRGYGRPALRDDFIGFRLARTPS
jgi:formylglycine-generating enzyme required for sulfatase activity